MVTLKHSNRTMHNFERYLLQHREDHSIVSVTSPTLSLIWESHYLHICRHVTVFFYNNLDNCECDKVRSYVYGVESWGHKNCRN